MNRRVWERKHYGPKRSRWESPKTLRGFGSPKAPRLLCLAGFGDDSSMFLPLAETELVRHYCVIVVDLPGFGNEPPFEDRFATLSGLAQAVADIASVQRTEIVVAHSVASVIASIAARGGRSGIRTVISLVICVWRLTNNLINARPSLPSECRCSKRSPGRYRMRVWRFLSMPSGTSRLLRGCWKRYRASTRIWSSRTRIITLLANVCG